MDQRSPSPAPVCSVSGGEAGVVLALSGTQAATWFIQPCLPLSPMCPGIWGRQRGRGTPYVAVAIWGAGLERILSLEGVCGDGLVMSAASTGGGAWALSDKASSALRHRGTVSSCQSAAQHRHHQHQHPTKGTCYLSTRQMINMISPCYCCPSHQRHVSTFQGAPGQEAKVKCQGAHSCPTCHSALQSFFLGQAFTSPA